MSCASGGPRADTDTTPPAGPPSRRSRAPDSEIGLAPGTAFEQPPQAPIAFNPVDPGESELRARPNAEFPPVIPHSIADLETITLSENSCLDCHDPEVGRGHGRAGGAGEPPGGSAQTRPDVTGDGGGRCTLGLHLVPRRPDRHRAVAP